MNSDILSLANILREYHQVHHLLEPSDIIMVLGTNDLRVVQRGVDLLKAGYAEKILFSGGIGRLTDHDIFFQGTTEAELFAQIAINQGVSENKIIIENKSTNTGENIQFSYQILQDKNIKSVILIQKPYMERRALATFEQQRPDTTTRVLVTSPQILFDDYPTDRLSIDLVIHMMVGDLQRIIEYPGLWFQSYQEVPSHVMLAYQNLIDLWFTEKMIL